MFSITSIIRRLRRRPPRPGIDYPVADNGITDNRPYLQAAVNGRVPRPDIYDRAIAAGLPDTWAPRDPGLVIIDDLHEEP